MKSTPDLTSQIHWLTLNSKPQFAFALKVLMPSTVFPSLFTSSTEPPSSLLEPTPGSYFPFFIHMQSNRVRHPDFIHETSSQAFPWLGIRLMDLSHVLETRSSFVLPLLALRAYGTATAGWHGDHPNTATTICSPSFPKNSAKPQRKHSRPAHYHLPWWSMLPK